MNSRTLSILSYVTIIGWVISYFSYKKEPVKNTLVHYHLEQGLGIFIVSALLNIGLNITAYMIPSLISILSPLGYAVILLWIFGVINAMNEQQKPVPLFGKMFEKKFTFID